MDFAFASASATDSGVFWAGATIPSTEAGTTGVGEAVAVVVWLGVEADAAGLVVLPEAAAEVLDESPEAEAVGESAAGEEIALLAGFASDESVRDSSRLVGLECRTFWMDVPGTIWAPVAAAPVEMPKQASEPITATTPRLLMRVFGEIRREARVWWDCSGLIGPANTTGCVGARARVGVQDESDPSGKKAAISCALAGRANRVVSAALSSDGAASVNAARAGDAARIGPRTRAGLAAPTDTAARAG